MHSQRLVFQCQAVRQMTRPLLWTLRFNGYLNNPVLKSSPAHPRFKRAMSLALSVPTLVLQDQQRLLMVKCNSVAEHRPLHLWAILEWQPLLHSMFLRMILRMELLQSRYRGINLLWLYVPRLGFMVVLVDLLLHLELAESLSQALL